VALNTLARCIADQQTGVHEAVEAEGNSNSAASALQRHRTTVVDCLKDPDISIRQRALELIYHLVNRSNVEALTAELLNYLVLCPREHRSDICTRILRVVDKYSPDDRWRVDTLITMLTIAGRECAPDVQSSTAVYISRSDEDLRAYSTHKLLKALRDDDGSQRGLLNVGIWCIGEYGDLLLKDYSYNPPVVEEGGEGPVHFHALEPSEVVGTVEGIMERRSCPAEVKARALTCFAKLRERYANVADVETLDKLESLVKKHEGSHSLELQLRSCEYGALLNAIKGVVVKRETVGAEEDIFGGGGGGTESVSDTVKTAAKEALARMPVVDIKLVQKKREERAGAIIEGGVMDPFDGGVDAAAAAAPASGGDSLLDLADIFGGGALAAAPTQNGSSSLAAPAPAAAQSDVDLLSDIFSAPAAPVAPMPAVGGFDIFSQPAQTIAASPLGNDIFGGSPVAPPAPPIGAPMMDPFGAASPPLPSPMQPQQVNSPAPTPAAAAAPSTTTVQGFSHQGLTVEFECSKPDTWNKQNSLLVAKFINTTDAPLYGLHLQVAVPKYVTMEMKPPTSTTVPVTGGSSTKHVTQTISVTNTMLGTKNLMLKLKASFTSKGTKVEHMATCSGFPAGQY
jgi:AP-1 complex subunit gamma-1